MSEDKRLLYHYTSFASATSILKNNSLWLSHIEYLNDAHEVKHGSDLVISSIVDFLESIKFSHYHTVEDLHKWLYINDVGLEFSLSLGKGKSQEELERKQKPFKEHILFDDELERYKKDYLNRFNFFVTCFSDKEDDLYQWNSYGDQAYGIAVGFDVDYLSSKEVESKGLTFLKVDYRSEHDKMKSVESLLSELLKKMPEFAEMGSCGSGHEKASEAMYLCYVDMIKLALSFKHQKFLAEGESRLVGIADKLSTENSWSYEFRTRETALIPYVQINLPDFQDAVREVVLGPLVDYEYNIKAINLFKEKYGYSFEVKKSYIPLKH